MPSYMWEVEVHRRTLGRLSSRLAKSISNFLGALQMSPHGSEHLAGEWRRACFVISE